MSEESMELLKKIKDVMNDELLLNVTKDGREYFLKLDSILFLETMDSGIAVHTAKEIFVSKEKMYSLEEMLPLYFYRVSKSTIVNTRKIRSIKKNITGASEIEFVTTNKIAYASRNYIKQLMDKLEEKRLK